MHPSLDELLALRDGEGSAEAAVHVERCSLCGTEVAELRTVSEGLKELPQLRPPGDAWWEIQKRRGRQRQRAVAIRFGSVAAAVVVVVVVAAVVGGRMDGTRRVAAKGVLDDSQAVVEQLSSASRELEAVLQAPALRTRVLSTHRAAMIVELEDRIALIDIALAANPEDDGDRAVVLWSDRVELLDALVAARGGSGRDREVTLAVDRNGRRK